MQLKKVHSPLDIGTRPAPLTLRKHKHPPVADLSTPQASNRRVTTNLSPTATEPPLFELLNRITEPDYGTKFWPKAKTKSRLPLTYADLALGDCRFPAAQAERERAAVVVFDDIRERRARLGTVYAVYYDGPRGRPRARARARADGNAEDPHPDH